MWKNVKAELKLKIKNKEKEEYCVFTDGPAMEGTYAVAVRPIMQGNNKHFLTEGTYNKEEGVWTLPDGIDAKTHQVIAYDDMGAGEAANFEFRDVFNKFELWYDEGFQTVTNLADYKMKNLVELRFNNLLIRASVYHESFPLCDFSSSSVIEKLDIKMELGPTIYLTMYSVGIEVIDVNKDTLKRVRQFTKPICSLIDYMTRELPCYIRDNTDWLEIEGIEEPQQLNWNVCLSSIKENKIQKSPNQPKCSGNYLCTCVKATERGTLRYLKMMYWDADCKIWRDGAIKGCFHTVLAWTQPIKTCQFSRFKHTAGGYIDIVNIRD